VLSSVSRTNRSVNSGVRIQRPSVCPADIADKRKTIFVFGGAVGLPLINIIEITVN